MMFKRVLQRYGDSPAPVTPYQRAGQEWDDRIGSARSQASNWRLTALGGLGLAFVLAGGMIWQSTQSRVAPYVVEVDQLGEAKAIAPANGHYKPNDSQIAYHLGQFISNVRSLSTDPVVVRNNWLRAYDYATDRGAAYLNDYARANDPFSDVGSRTVAIQVTSVVRATGSTYQVKWIEQTYKQGNLDHTSHWTAMLTIVTQAPKTADTLRKNPLGLYVNGLSWTEELTPTKTP